MDRRDFLLRSALASVGLTLAPTLGCAPASATIPLVSPASGMGGYVSLASRVAITDALHLAAADRQIPDMVRTALTDFYYHQFVVSGDAIEATPTETAALLRELRDLWPDRDDRPHDRGKVRGDMAEQRLAWAAGRLAHDAIVPVLGTPDAETARARDAQLLRALHDAAPAPVHGDGPDAAALADLLRVAHQRTAIRLHTYQPDREDVDGWVGRFVSWDAEQHSEADRLAEAILSEADDPAFLDPADPAFRAARHVRQARAVPPAAVAEALSQPGTSAYARAVAEAALAMRRVGQFMAGDDSALDQ